MIKHKLHSAFSYLQYIIGKKNAHHLHSPFLYDFYTRVIKGKSPQPDLEAIRRELIGQDEYIEVLDLGAGSHKNNKSKRKLSEIAKTALKPKKHAEFLYRFAQYFPDHQIVELGTSLGLTTLYLQKASKNKVVTIEGSPEIRKVAIDVFEKAEEVYPKPSSLLGNFDSVLPVVLSEIQNPFIIYIDGNHSYEATMTYYHWIKSVWEEGSIIIFDDIYWSSGMTKAWDEIRKDKDLSLSVDLFQFGIVFNKKEMREKQDFVLSYFSLFT